MIYKFKEFIPVIDKSSFIHPLAAVTGQVIIGKNVYVGPGACLRGDFGKIVVEDGCNIQENCVLHSFPGAEVWLKENAHIGHGATIHGSIIGKNCLIGIQAVVMDEVELGDECIVGAHSFVKQREKFPARSLIVGSPARKIKEVSDDMIDWKMKGTKIYQQLAADMHQYWEPCEPLTEIPPETKEKEEDYKPWKSAEK